MFEVHFSISDNILTMSLGSSFFFWCLYNTLAEFFVPWPKQKNKGPPPPKKKYKKNKKKNPS
jgi:hypothetical protein